MLKNKLDTMDKVFSFVVKEFADKQCLGTRQILAEEDEVQPSGRVFKKVTEHLLFSFIFFKC